MMTSVTLQLPEALYQLFVRQAAHLQLSPEQMLEQVLQGDLVLVPIDDVDPDSFVVQSDYDHALQAVERLTTRFAHMMIPNLESHLHDPMIALANSAIEPAFDE